MEIYLHIVNTEFFCVNRVSVLKIFFFFNTSILSFTKVFSLILSILVRWKYILYNFDII